jgi:hypothetical protein
MWKREVMFLYKQVSSASFSILPSCLGTHADSWVGTYRDRNEALLIRCLPNEVAHRKEAAHQKVIDLAVLILYGAGRHTATDFGRRPPDQLSVMPVIVRRSAILLHRRAWDIICFFVDPEVEHRYQRRVHIYGVMGSRLSSGLGIISEVSRRVERAVERRLIVGPSLGAGGERVAPHERRNSNGSALAVNDLQDDEISIVTYL